MAKTFSDYYEKEGEVTGKSFGTEGRWRLMFNIGWGSSRPNKSKVP